MVNMKKIASILIVSLFVCLGFASVVGGTGEVDGSIDVVVKEKFWMLVAPEINLENSSITLSVEQEGTGDNKTYFVNDTIRLNLDVTFQDERNVLLSRGVAYSAIIMRSFSVEMFNILKGMTRLKLFPILKLFGTATVVNGSLATNTTIDESIDLSAKYYINEDIYNNGENLTMHLFTMGIFPGDINGFTEETPYIDYKKLTLDADYV